VDGTVSQSVTITVTAASSTGGAASIGSTRFTTTTRART
jgi:hypothetical protein